jgi:uncharacterized Zn finger protein
MTSPGVPFANILHQEAIALLSGSTSFERGKRYFKERRVVALARRDGSLTATVNGVEAYAVKIWAHLDTLAYTCSCPQGQEKAFCKHAVATALAWLDSPPISVDPVAKAESAPPPASDEASVEAWETAMLETLRGRSKEALIDLLLGATRTDRFLRARILKRS